MIKRILLILVASAVGCLAAATNRTVIVDDATGLLTGKSTNFFELNGIFPTSTTTFVKGGLTVGSTGSVNQVGNTATVTFPGPPSLAAVLAIGNDAGGQEIGGVGTITFDGTGDSFYRSGSDTIFNSLNGALILTSGLRMSGLRITDVGTPTFTTDAVNKQYADSIVSTNSALTNTVINIISNYFLVVTNNLFIQYNTWPTEPLFIVAGDSSITGTAAKAYIVTNGIGNPPTIYLRLANTFTGRTFAVHNLYTNVVRLIGVTGSTNVLVTSTNTVLLSPTNSSNGYFIPASNSVTLFCDGKQSYYKIGDDGGGITSFISSNGFIGIFNNTNSTFNSTIVTQGGYLAVDFVDTVSNSLQSAQSFVGGEVNGGGTNTIFGAHGPHIGTLMYLNGHGTLSCEDGSRIAAFLQETSHNSVYANWASSADISSYNSANIDITATFAGSFRGDLYFGSNQTLYTRSAGNSGISMTNAIALTVTNSASLLLLTGNNGSNIVIDLSYGSGFLGVVTNDTKITAKRGALVGGQPPRYTTNTVTGDIYWYGNETVTGTNTASYFVGNGAGITNVSVSATNTFPYGIRTTNAPVIAHLALNPIIWYTNGNYRLELEGFLQNTNVAGIQDCDAYVRTALNNVTNIYQLYGVGVNIAQADLLGIGVHITIQPNALYAFTNTTGNLPTFRWYQEVIQ